MEEKQNYEGVDEEVHCFSSPNLLETLQTFPITGTLNFSHFVSSQDAEVMDEFLLDCYRREAAVAF